ncbi:permease [Clostridiisalibacter paucivorans]|uniref:permease n=1 Tax=Clostridiisalibacter paucivorans TaxID=408753 RepID=UPI000B22509C|nr:permease [Clostridiisalibacter paucivorans]
MMEFLRLDIFTILLWVITVMAFFISLLKDKNKTLKSMAKSKKMMKNMVSQIIAILLLIGLMLTFMPPEIIKDYLGNENSFIATTISALIGSITLIPAFVAFPLVGSLVDMGASLVPVAAFLTTLTMVGVVTFPIERKEFGMRFALIRNSMSFIFAILIAIIMGVLI